MVPNNTHNGKEQGHTRVLNSMLGAAEKKLLVWMAAKMPAWVTPDTLTAVGLAASVIIFAGYALTYFDKSFLWLASLGFILNWFGDSMDGTLARYRKIERPRYGFFVDHIIDAVSEMLVFVGLGLSPFLRFDLALMALIGYLMVSVYVYLVTYVNGVFRISYAGLGPTEMRIIAIVANAIVFFSPNLTIPVPAITLPGGLAFAATSLTFYDLVAVGVILLAISVFSVSSVQTAMELSMADRLASKDKRKKEKAALKAQRVKLRNERAMRKAAAREARAKRLHIPNTGLED